MGAEVIRNVYFNGPPLVLTKSPDLIRNQLSTQERTIVDPLNHTLAPGITTDAIIPADACKTLDADELAEHVLTGMPDRTVGKGDVRKLSANVWVAGDNFGSGSSREHAPIASQFAGCGLIIAKSFAPIFRRNAVALGLYTSTNFDLLEFVEQNRPIPLHLLNADLDTLSKDVLDSGGLLPFLQHIGSGKKHLPTINTPPRPMTIAEKWLAKYLGVPYVKPQDGGFVKPGFAYSYEYTAPWSLFLLRQFLGYEPVSISNPQQLVLFNDHLPLDTDSRSQALEEATRLFARNYGIRLYDATGKQYTSQGQMAICHIKMADLVTPGIHVGTDSHTPMIAPFGGYVFGIGATDFAGIMHKGMVMTTVPESVRINLNGDFLPFVTTRDLMLSLNTDKKAFVGKVMEFGGPALPNLTPLELAIMANMSAEARAITSTFDPHVGVVNTLVRSGRFASLDAALAVFPTADPNTAYQNVVGIDLHTVQPTVATPSSPDTGKPLDQIPPTRINKAIIGACVGGGIEDIRLAAYILRGKRVHPDVQLIIHPHSIAALNYAEQKGWIKWIEDAGGTAVREIGCGACIGNGPGTLEENDICITSDSRNHEGRMGHPNAKVFLASSVVCAVSALVGGTPTMADIYKYTQTIPWEEKVSLFSL